MKIIVTGASGFLGGIVTTQLEANDHTIIRVERRAMIDVRNAVEMASLPDCDLVLHLAAKSFIPDAYENPQLFYETNVGGTINALEVARKRNARFLFVSSYVYGHPKYLPIDENHPRSAVNPYGQSKLIGEDLVTAFHRDFKLNVCIIRPFNIYGVGQPNHFLLPKIIHQAKTNGEIEVFDLRPKRDYVEVSDVARAITLAVQSNFTGCKIYNVGSGISFSIGEVVDILRPMFNSELKVRTLEKHRRDEIMDTVCNPALITQSLAWKPLISFEMGLRQMVNS